MNHAGRASSDVASKSLLTSGATTGLLSIEALAPDLFVYALGVNDIAAATTPSAYAAYVAYALDYARAGNPLCDIVMVAPHRGNLPDPGQLYPQFMVELRAIAESYGAMLVNFWPIGKNSYPYWSKLGYFGDDGWDGLAGADPVHPSDAGYAFMASVLTPLLTQ